MWINNSTLFFLFFFITTIFLPAWKGVVPLCAEGQDSPETQQQQQQHKENRLAGSASPYLRSAGFQLIDWYEYGEEAFALAKRLDRPILLDISAIYCHWCH